MARNTGRPVNQQLTPAQWRQANGIARGRTTDAEIEAAVRAEIRRVERETTPQSRCRVCREPEAMYRVNLGLANGMTYDAIYSSLDEVNRGLPKPRRVTYHSLLGHAKDHFDLNSPAQAVYRRMLEKRLADDEQIKVDGASTILTTLGYLEVMGQKGFETLVKDNTTVSPEAGMAAMLKLHELTEGSSEMETVELRAKVAALGTAVRDVVPPELWSKILDRMDDIANGMGPSSTTTVEVQQDEIEAEPYEPDLEADLEDSLED